MAESRRSARSRSTGGGAGWGRLVSRLERDEGELLPGIVVRDGKIAPGPGATDPANWIELGKFAFASGKLLWSLLRDPRVPMRGKVVAGAAAAYAISPLDVVPDFIPVGGYMDDVVIVVGAVRYLTDVAGADIVYEHWTGTPEGLELLVRLVARD